jgi:molybdenum cofactor synthesis domain-containing protein
MSETTPTAAILIIGNEVLSGRTPDSNINTIARRLNEMGIALREVRVVRDVESEIIEAINPLRAKYSYVFTTGGIGPTHDDITVPTLAKAFGVAIERNLQVEQKLRDNMGARTTPAGLRMADFPAGARIIPHGENFAPGFMMENVIVLAGLPRVMTIMLEAALPLLQQGAPIHTRQVDAWVYESVIAAPLEAIQQRFPETDIGSYPYRVDTRVATALVVRGTNAEQVEGAYNAIGDMLDDLGADRRAA